MALQNYGGRAEAPDGDCLGALHEAGEMGAGDGLQKSGWVARAARQGQNQIQTPTVCPASNTLLNPMSDAVPVPHPKHCSVPCPTACPSTSEQHHTPYHLQHHGQYHVSRIRPRIMSYTNAENTFIRRTSYAKSNTKSKTTAPHPLLRPTLWPSLCSTPHPHSVACSASCPIPYPTAIFRSMPHTMSNRCNTTSSVYHVPIPHPVPYGMACQAPYTIPTVRTGPGLLTGYGTWHVTSRFGHTTGDAGRCI